jgi:hypothetical protein
MTTKNINDSPDQNTQREQPEKPFLSFSIENILRKEPFKCRDPVQENPTVHRVRGKKTSEKETTVKSADSIFVRLPWLAYTRYCPPKIPSKFLVECEKYFVERTWRVPANQLFCEDCFLVN